MMSTVTTTPAAGRDAAAWRGADLASDARWMMHFDDAERTDLLRVLRAGHRPGQSLLAYRRSDFPFGPAALAKIRRAVDEAQHGLGVALLKGFPRESVTPDEFVLLTWAVGLYVGVARPQDRRTRYINRVQDVGTVYRLFRLWLATPDSPRLPAGWDGFYESTEPGVVRGGAYGQHYDDECRRFDAEQAQAMGMRLGPGFSN